ncbi:MAG: hypothetical protein ACREUI_03350 [Burkholderiales bacterium]
MGRKTQASALNEEQQIAKRERLFHEINLLRLEGYYFTFDPKAAHLALDPMKSVEKRLRNPQINAIEPVEIIPHSAYGKPSVFSYKVFKRSSKSFPTMDILFPKPSHLAAEKSCVFPVVHGTEQQMPKNS